MYSLPSEFLLEYQFAPEARDRHVVDRHVIGSAVGGVAIPHDVAEHACQLCQPELYVIKATGHDTDPTVTRGK